MGRMADLHAVLREAGVVVEEHGDVIARTTTRSDVLQALELAERAGHGLTIEFDPGTLEGVSLSELRLEVEDLAPGEGCAVDECVRCACGVEGLHGYVPLSELLSA